MDNLSLAARARDPFLNFLSATLNISLHGDFAQSESGRPLQSTIKWTPLYVEMQKTKLTDFSPKILNLIFNNLDTCSSTCLGLTAWSLFSIFRYHHPGKISLWEACYEPTYAITTSLGDLLEPWMGSTYRRRIWTLYTFASSSPLREHAYPIPQYLKKSVYSDKENEEDDRLALRYLDHGLSQKTCNKTGDISFVLPSPFGMGENWYFQAFEAMKMDVHPLGNWGMWMGFWGEFDVFGRMACMEKLRMLEWFEDCEKRGSLEESWRKMFWFVLGLGLCMGWWRRWLRFGVMRSVGRKVERPWPSPRRKQRVVQEKIENEDGMV